MIKSVNILGRKYTVQYKNEVFRDDGAELFGQINYGTGIIEISEKDRSDQCKFETLVHEVMHGILERTGARNSFTKDQIETICDLAPLLVQTMKGIK